VIVLFLVLTILIPIPKVRTYRTSNSNYNHPSSYIVRILRTTKGSNALAFASNVSDDDAPSSATTSPVHKGVFDFDSQKDIYERNIQYLAKVENNPSLGLGALRTEENEIESLKNQKDLLDTTIECYSRYEETINAAVPEEHRFSIADERND
jgi:hypothetical protein